MMKCFITPVILGVTLVVAFAAIFLLPKHHDDSEFPFTDGVRIYDGSTRLNFSTPEGKDITEVNLILWPGERESFQLLLTRNDGLGDIMVNGGISPEFVPFDPAESPGNENFPSSTIPKLTVSYEHYVTIRKTNIERGPLGSYPDALLTWDAGDFKDLGNDESASLYIEVSSDTYAVPGKYSGEVTVNIGGEVTHIPVNLTVINLNVDAGPLPVVMGVSEPNFTRLIDAANKSSDAGRDTVTQQLYEDFALQLYVARAFPMNLNALNHPEVEPAFGELEISYTVMDSSLEYLFGFSPVKQFPLTVHDVKGSSGVIRGEMDSPQWNADFQSYVSSVAQHFRDKGWMDQAFCYVIDEPKTEADYKTALDFGRKLHEAAPDLKYLLTEQPYHLPKQEDWPDLGEVVDIWCPQLGFYREEQCRAVQEAGKEVWIYPNQVDYKSFEPEILSPTLNIGDEFLSPEILVAVIYKHGIQGLLYWDCIYWKNVDPFENPNPSGNTDREFFGNGDGYLFYPGDVINKHLPEFENHSLITSIRWAKLVEGLEDYRFLEQIGFPPEDMPSSREMLSNPSEYSELIHRLKAELVVSDTPQPQ